MEVSMEASVLDKKDEQALAILRQFADGYEVQLARGGDGATYELGGLPLYVIGALMYGGAPPFRKR
ncbi:MAG: hypothetical protein HYT82_01730, partial [Candidatus Harrisonbacteria bacterium]|nr:hypothetical protein [Candidatus Harrisonbacteria bacterium]